MAAFCRFEDRVYLKLDGLKISVDLFRFSSHWLYRFGCDTYISRCQRVEIMENCEEYGASQKRKFLYINQKTAGITGQFKTIRFLGNSGTRLSTMLLFLLFSEGRRNQRKIFYSKFPGQ